MENETTPLQTPEELEIASAFAEFADDKSAAPAAGTKTAEEIAAEAEAAKTAAAAGTKTAEEIAAEAEAAKTAAGTKTAEEIAAEAEAAKTAAAAGTKTAEEIAAEAAAAKTAEEQSAATASKAAAPADDPRIAALQAEIEALKPKEPKVEPAPIYTAEEETILKKHAEDWPDIAKAEALARRAEYHDLARHIFQQITQRYDPVLEYVDKRSETDQYTDLVKLVPDYDQVRDKALAWVETQPAWLKTAYSRVVNEGTPEEVAGLIGMFKKETSYVAQAATGTQKPAAAVAPAAPAPAAAISPEAKAAAAKLTLVKTNRTEAGTAAEDSFESAFTEFATQEEQRLSQRK